VSVFPWQTDFLILAVFFESCADSLASYAHDDIDYYRRSRRSYNDYDDDDFGGYEKPISRNDTIYRYVIYMEFINDSH
jgi:hypothetical protein